MNCQDCQIQISQLTLSDLRKDTAASLHLHGCEECQHYYQDQQVKVGLKQLGKVPVNIGLQSRILANIQQHTQSGQHTQSPKKNQPFKIVYGAIAASFLVFGLILQPLLMKVTSPNIPSMALVQVSVGSLQTVNVMLESEFNYQATELSVNMQGPVSLDNAGKIQSVAWRTNLNKGKNVLPLPVYLASPLGGEIHVKMKTDDGFKSFVLQVKAKVEPPKRMTI